jgi:hypothetical protein
MENKNIVWIIIFVLILGGIAYGVWSFKILAPTTNPSENIPGINNPGALPKEIDLKNMTYSIENRQITLVNGIYEEQIPGSATKETIQLSDYVATGQLNGNTGAAAILIDTPGGSGTFYYLTAIFVKNDRYQTTNSALLGDRIKIQSLSIENEIIKVIALDREPTDPMSAEPTVQKNLEFKIESGQLVPVSQ